MATDAQIVSGITEKVLTHEVGAGAACLKCGDKCPGLDLHFWRKICRNCKCKQEDHDVLSSVSTRGINNIGKLLMQDVETNNSPQAPTKQTAPAPAPKPVKQVPQAEVAQPATPAPAPATPPATPPATATATATVTYNNTSSHNSSGNSPVKAASNLNVTIDIGGKKHQLDFGSSEAEENKVVYDDTYPDPPVDDLPPPLPPPPADLENEPLPGVPPLPEEFAEKVVVTEKHNNDVDRIQNNIPAVAQTQAKQTAPTLDASSSDDEEKEYDWTPPVADEKLVSGYISALPKEKRPIVGTTGAKYRKKQLMRQLPTHDQEPGECHDLTPQETQEMQLFVKKYRERALGGGKVEENGKNKSCAECHEVLNIGDVIVWAERAGTERYWHPGCFCCAECKELLVDLIYFFHEDKIYCGRHYCELHKPRCAACDELIFAPEYTQAEDCYWHLKHFCCWHCDQPLGGKNYVPHDNQPVCIPCYEKSFAHSCSTCKEIIAPNTEWVTFEEFHWHAQPECFKCTQCEKSLVGKPCIPKGEMVFCCSQCKRARIPPGQ